MKNIITDFNQYSRISENVMYHLDNNMDFTKNIFRFGSESFYSLLEEVRDLYDSDIIKLYGIDEELFNNTDIGRWGLYENSRVPLDIPMLNEEATYKGKSVNLNKPMRSDGKKKYKVYVKNPKTGNVMVVNFGDVKGGLTAKINNPEARKRFAQRHDCANKRDKTKPSYWSCRLPRYANQLGLSGGGNFYW
jgi:hypothetical protein